MAQDGDTITYTFSDGTSVAEDISDVNELTVDYMDGSGAYDSVSENPGSGGRVENVTVDISSESTLYIWVGGGEFSTDGSGRYRGGAPDDNHGGGSTEIAFVNTDSSDSSDEPFIVAAGGAGSTQGASSGGGGARGGDTKSGVFGGTDDRDAEGVAPPAGGDAASNPDDPSIRDGDGAIDSRSIISGGTTITGGGSSSSTNGEVQISYQVTLSPPDPPSNLNASVQ